MGVLSQLEPKEVFSYFEEICSIPHASYHEDKISDYCVDFAKKHGLEVYQDDLKNVIIIKEATSGYEKEPPLILQGHLDMVCEKVPDSDFNFDTDSLKLMIEEDYITADGTTLGGDDGIAVAYALAILASDSIAHPRLEVIFTSSEEVGMEGASGIDVSMLKGNMLLNMDSEEEGIFLAGCAGGASIACRIPVHRVESVGVPMKITAYGMAGGHSGTEINRGRANANTLMGRILVELAKNVPFHLTSLEGGGKDNAIPRECTAGLYLEFNQYSALDEIMKKLQQDFAEEYAVTDKNIRIRLSTGTDKTLQVPSDMLDEDSTRKVIMLINALPNGVQTMSADVDGLVETSLNLGVLRLEGSEAILSYAVRSSVGSAKTALIDKMTYLTQGMGGSVQLSGEYPAWEYKRDSALRNKMEAVYKQMYGKKPEIQAIHAGLECGLLAGKIPGLDCVSIGPDMQAVHTSEEKLSISSVKRVWEFILEVLRAK